MWSLCESVCVYLQYIKLLLNGYLYLSTFCSWRGRARRSCAQDRGSIPEGRMEGNGPLSASRWVPERSSGSHPPHPPCTHRNLGRTFHTSLRQCFHSDWRTDGESYDRLDSITWNEIRALSVLKKIPFHSLIYSHTRPKVLRYETDQHITEKMQLQQNILFITEECCTVKNVWKVLM